MPATEPVSLPRGICYREETDDFITFSLTKTFLVQEKITSPNFHRSWTHLKDRFPRYNLVKRMILEKLINPETFKPIPATPATSEEIEQPEHSSNVKSPSSSDNIETHSTGARGSGEYVRGLHLLSQIASRRWANAMMAGLKHGAYNWLQGIPAEALWNHLQTHLSAFLQGDSSEDHLGHALARLAMLIHFSETRPELFDSMPPGCKDGLLKFLKCKSCPSKGSCEPIPDCGCPAGKEPPTYCGSEACQVPQGTYVDDLVPLFSRRCDHCGGEIGNSLYVASPYRYCSEQCRSSGPAHKRPDQDRYEGEQIRRCHHCRRVIDPQLPTNQCGDKHYCSSDCFRNDNPQFKYATFCSACGETNPPKGHDCRGRKARETAQWLEQQHRKISLPEEFWHTTALTESSYRDIFDQVVGHVFDRLIETLLQKDAES